MTTMQLNAEILRSLSYIEDNEDYLRQVLDFINKLGHKKKTPVKKIKVDMSVPLPTDKYVGILKSTREDDAKAKENYMKEKYGEYL